MKLLFITMLMLLINNCNARADEAKNKQVYGLKDNKFFGKQVDGTTLFFLAIAFPTNLAVKKAIEEMGQNLGPNNETILAQLKAAEEKLKDTPVVMHFIKIAKAHLKAGHEFEANNTKIFLDLLLNAENKEKIITNDNMQEVTNHLMIAIYDAFVKNPRDIKFSLDNNNPSNKLYYEIKEDTVEEKSVLEKELEKEFEEKINILTNKPTLKSFIAELNKHIELAKKHKTNLPMELKKANGMLAQLANAPEDKHHADKINTASKLPKKMISNMNFNCIENTQLIKIYDNLEYDKSNHTFLYPHFFYNSGHLHIQQTSIEGITINFIPLYNNQDQYVPKTEEVEAAQFALLEKLSNLKMIDSPYFMEYINKKTDLNEKLNVINIISDIIDDISTLALQKTEALNILHTKTLSHAQIQYLSIEHLLYIKNNLNTLPFLYLYQPSIYSQNNQLVMITTNSTIDNVEQSFIPLKNKKIIYIKNNELCKDNLYEQLLANKLEEINKKLQEEIKQRDALKIKSPHCKMNCVKTLIR